MPSELQSIDAMAIANKKQNISLETILCKLRNLRDDDMEIISSSFYI